MASDRVAFPSKTLVKLIASLTSRPSPVVVDLGSVIPSNVSFFCETLGCKAFVEDVCADLERHAREAQLDRMPVFLRERFSRPSESVDAILCWDVIDYLDKPSGEALAEQLIRMLKPEGVLLGFFGNMASRELGYVKYVIADGAHLTGRIYDGARVPRRSWLNRDILRLFQGLEVADSFLLKSGQREILFRKPA